MGIGKRIKQARELIGFTQKELGDIIGVTGSSITNYENETSHPKEPVMYKLIDALNVDANFLFQDCVNKTKPTNQKAVGLSNEAYDIGRAYDTANEKDKATVRLVLSVEPSAEPKLYTFVTAAKGKGLREAQLTEANMEAARRAVRELEGKD